MRDRHIRVVDAQHACGGEMARHRERRRGVATADVGNRPAGREVRVHLVEYGADQFGRQCRTRQEVGPIQVLFAAPHPAVAAAATERLREFTEAGAHRAQHARARVDHRAAGRLQHRYRHRVRQRESLRAWIVAKISRRGLRPQPFPCQWGGYSSPLR